MTDEALEAPELAPPKTEASRRGVRLEWASLGEPALTIAFWGSVALYVAAMWVPRFPPLVDYPQHLGIAALLRRWLDPTSPERALYDVNLFTYNASFHTLVALLAFVVPVETAGRIVLSLVPPLFGVGALALARVAKRPRYYALFALPFVFNSVLTWGFVNNSLGYAVAFTVVAWFYRAMDGEPRLYRRAAVAAVVVAWLHICAAFFVCAASGIAALARLARSTGPVKERFGAFAKTCVALVPSALLSGAFVLYNATSSHANWENGTHDGLDEYAWRKVVHFADLVVGNFVDGSDRRLFVALLLAVLALYAPVKVRNLAPRPLRAVVVFFALLYLLVPRVLFATWFMFERFGLVLAVLVCVWAPVVRWSRAPAYRVLAMALAIVTPLNVLRHVATIPEEDDASAVLDAVPDGAKVQGLIWDPSPWPVLERQTWVHFQSYTLTRHRGIETMPSFTFIESMPVHYKPERRPPRPPAAFEWTPERYSLDDPWARYFTTLLVRAPYGESDPRRRLFGDDADAVRVLSHHGRFWLFDLASLHARR